jgi:hypothetical protein
MTTVDMVVAEISNSSAYLNNQLALVSAGAANFDIASCRSSTVRGICTMISAIRRVDAAAGTKLTSALAGSPFLSDEVTLIAAAIDAKRAAAANVPPSAQTISKQTFATDDASQHFFTDSDWMTFMSPTVPWKLKCHTAMHRLNRAGLSNPTEKACCDIAVTIGECHWSDDKADPMELYGIVTHLKKIAGTTSPTAPHLPFLQIFPATPSSLPQAHYDSAYADEAPVQGRIVEWTIARQRYSTRGTNKRVRDSIAAAGGKSGRFAKLPAWPASSAPSELLQQQLAVIGSTAAPRVVSPADAVSIDPRVAMDIMLKLVQAGLPPQTIHGMMAAARGPTADVLTSPLRSGRSFVPFTFGNSNTDVDTKTGSSDGGARGGGVGGLDPSMRGGLLATSATVRDNGANSDGSGTHGSLLTQDLAKRRTDTPSEEQSDRLKADKALSMHMAKHDLLAASTAADAPPHDESQASTAATAPPQDESQVSGHKPVEQFAAADTPARVDEADKGNADEIMQSLSDLAPKGAKPRRRSSTKLTPAAYVTMCSAATPASTYVAASLSSIFAPAQPSANSDVEQPNAGAPAAPKRLSVREMQAHHMSLLKQSADADKAKRAEVRAVAKQHAVAKAKAVAAAMATAKSLADGDPATTPTAQVVKAAAEAAFAKATKDGVPKRKVQIPAVVVARPGAAAPTVKTEIKNEANTNVKIEPKDTVGPATPSTDSVASAPIEPLELDMSLIMTVAKATGCKTANAFATRCYTAAKKACVADGVSFGVASATMSRYERAGRAFWNNVNKPK